jgi:hypothetical protein
MSRRKRAGGGVQAQKPLEMVLKSLVKNLGKVKPLPIHLQNLMHYFKLFVFS